MLEIIIYCTCNAVDKKNCGYDLKYIMKFLFNARQYWKIIYLNLSLYKYSPQNLITCGWYSFLYLH